MKDVQFDEENNGIPTTISSKDNNKPYKNSLMVKMLLKLGIIKDAKNANSIFIFIIIICCISMSIVLYTTFFKSFSSTASNSNLTEEQKALFNQMSRPNTLNQ